MTEQLQSAIRSVLKLVGGGLIAKGYTDASTLEMVIAGVIAAVGIGWSIIHHKTPPAA